MAVADRHHRRSRSRGERGACLGRCTCLRPRGDSHRPVVALGDGTHRAFLAHPFAVRRAGVWNHWLAHRKTEPTTTGCPLRLIPARAQVLRAVAPAHLMQGGTIACGYFYHRINQSTTTFYQFTVGRRATLYGRASKKLTRKRTTMDLSPNILNWYAGWWLLLAAFITGAGLGMFFHRDNFLGGYGSFRRRMLRLGHIALAALGVVDLLVAPWASASSVATRCL